MRTITRVTTLTLIILTIVMLARAPFSGAPAADVTEADTATGVHAAPSLLFIANAGQYDPRARFLVQGSDRAIWLADDGIWVTVTTAETAAAVKLSFPDANPRARIEPFGQLATSVNYFIGNDPANWQTNVPVYGGVRYRDLYPGIDLEISGAGGKWEWRLVCTGEPCAPDTLGQVRLRVEGAEPLTPSGAKPAAVAPERPAAIRLATTAGEFTLPLLTASGAEPQSPRIERLAAYRFDLIGPFAGDPTQPPNATLTSESDLLYATFLGGGDYDSGNDIALDNSSHVYVTGTTCSTDFPATAGAFDTTFNGNNYDCDAFVVKLNPTGTGLVYATFLGGNGDERGNAIAMDGSGNVYVTGESSSTNFPTIAGTFDTTLGGSLDAFVVKLNPTGTALAYATFLGGSGYDEGNAIAVDNSGHAYVVGYTSSADFPATAGAFDTTLGGTSDAFVVKLNPNGTALVYATFLGGSEGDNGYDTDNDIAVDSSGHAYVVGSTYSADFPTTAGAFDTTFNGGFLGDAFVVKLNPTGTALVYATFLGSSGDDQGSTIAVDGSGHAYVTGYTYSAAFPTTLGAFDTSFNGGNTDAFVVKINPTGTALVYATFLGGSRDDRGIDIKVDGSGRVYVTGETNSANFPTTPGAFDTTLAVGTVDAFVVKLNATGTALAYATFLGGNNLDGVSSITVDGSSNVYVTGYTYSADFPTTAGAFDTTYNGGEAFVVKLDLADTYTLSGRITTAAGAPVAGVTVNAGARATTTDANGDYTLTKVKAGTYTLTPALSGYIFTPASRTVTVTSDVSGLNFTAIAGFAISGVVRDRSGNPVAGVAVTAGSHSTTTDSAGAFTLIVPTTGTYTLTPVKAGYAFDPPSQRVAVTTSLSGIAFRAFQPDPAKPIDLIVSFDGNPTPAQRAIYEEVFYHFADAVFEFSNGAHKLRSVQMFTNGAQREVAHIRWLATSCLPQAHSGSYLVRGMAIIVCDTIAGSNANLLANPKLAGYLLAHNWGHAFYGLYDEGPLDAPCQADRPDRACSTDHAVTYSLMNPEAPWHGVNDIQWLNASTPLNRQTQTAQYRMYQSSCWETLTRPLWQDPRVAGRYPPRPYHPELAAVAPASGQAASIELVSGHHARSLLTVQWDAGATIASVAEVTASVTVLNGDPAPAGAPLMVAAVLRAGYPIVGATAIGVLRAADGQEWRFTLRDDGSGPDWQANDGMYSGQVTPAAAGPYTVEVTFTNPDGAAIEVYDSGSIIVPPGETLTIPPPRPLETALHVTAQTTVTAGNSRSWQVNLPLVLR